MSKLLSIFLLTLLILITPMITACQLTDALFDSDKGTEKFFKDSVAATILPEVAAIKKAEEDYKASMTTVYYFEAEKEERYRAFHKLHPEMPMDEIIWRVNAELDKDFYEDTVEAKDYDSINVLTSKHISVPENYVPNDLVWVDGVMVRDVMLDDFMELKAAALKDGFTIVGYSGYRNYETQNYLYENDIETRGFDIADVYTARPGFSEHQTGLTLDLDNADPTEKFSESDEAVWVKNNGHNYGFIVRYTPENEDITGIEHEPWHVRYIGPEHSKRMVDLGITSYEEYKIKHVDFQPK